MQGHWSLSTQVKIRTSTKPSHHTLNVFLNEIIFIPSCVCAATDRSNWRNRCIRASKCSNSGVWTHSWRKRDVEMATQTDFLFIPHLFPPSFFSFFFFLHACVHQFLLSWQYMYKPLIRFVAFVISSEFSYMSRNFSAPFHCNRDDVQDTDTLRPSLRQRQPLPNDDAPPVPPKVWPRISHLYCVAYSISSVAETRDRTLGFF